MSSEIPPLATREPAAPDLELDGLIGLLEEGIENEEFGRSLRVAGGGVAVTDDETPMPFARAFKDHVAAMRSVFSRLRAAPPALPPDLLAAIADMEFARSSHLAWAEHLEAHRASSEPCAECEAKPYKLIADHEREWVQKYDAVIALLKLAAPPALQGPQEPQTVSGDTSDGYHTFNELYEYRKAFNALLFNEWAARGLYDTHKSLKHSDGELCFGGGWFIVSAQTPQGQVTNHYKAEDWKLFHLPVREHAAEWDGHTPQIALQRLLVLALAGSPQSPAQELPPAALQGPRLRALAQDAIADMKFARSSHLAWATHLEAHEASGESCQECAAKPYKLDIDHEREWVRKYDVVIALLKSAAPLPALHGLIQEWRDIESVPKDGSYVLLWFVYDDGEGMAIIGSWVQFDDPAPEGYHDGWCNHINGHYLEELPTHWMPLPDPPQKEDTK